MWGLFVITLPSGVDTEIPIVPRNNLPMISIFQVIDTLTMSLAPNDLVV